MTSGRSAPYVEYEGITAITDIVSTTHYREMVLISAYGSESQLRGIFSALATSRTIKYYSQDEESLAITRGEGLLRYKSFKFGYGKYHAVMWDEILIKDCIIPFQGETTLQAWERFLQFRKIPYIAEWIPRIEKLCLKEGIITKLEGSLKGYYWTGSDDEVCDLIVKDLYKNKTKLKHNKEDINNGERNISKRIYY